MSYLSIDSLQKVLSEQVFFHTKDAKKAAGRALGTMIEIISYYLLNEWGLNDSISIERGLPEYGNPSITHNVEFTLHPLLQTQEVFVANHLPLTSSKILKIINLGDEFTTKSNCLLDKNLTLRNACNIAESSNMLVLSTITDITDSIISVKVNIQHQKPYAMFECKRVGVEEGNKKGPQTIEKAKQGAYVAQNTSSLQKIRNEKGEKYGIIYDNNKPIIQPYSDLLHSIIISKEHEKLLKNFTLSVGIVSNHGNWFTSENPNKELKVLAQSYDWLLFLSDLGLAQFITDLLLSPAPQYESIKTSFLDSYKEGKKSNIFTKVKMNLAAHMALCHYFHSHINEIENWFNIISPQNASIMTLKNELYILRDKNWEEIV
ncbi:hypothetical protein [Barnesiella sp. An22]|uniref:hypothetical protein n=1 Tax=Barnesiella sp. An22 TaxID=1965590 RepID=UPI00320A06F1